MWFDKVVNILFKQKLSYSIATNLKRSYFNKKHLLVITSFAILTTVPWEKPTLLAESIFFASTSLTRTQRAKQAKRANKRTKKMLSFAVW